MIPSQLVPFANHLWQSTLFAAGAGLLTLLLRNNRARMRYWLWLSASVKFLIPFSILVNVGGLLGRHTAASIPPPTFISAAGLSSAIEQVGEPFTMTAAQVAMPGADWSYTSVIVPVFIAVWAVGFASLFCRWSMHWRRMRASVRTALPLNLPIGLPVKSSPAFGEPGVFGILRPALLLPVGIVDCLTTREMEAIVAHELCHIRRRDNLTTAIHMAVESLFWFHPLVWWLGARLIEERERACDEEVLRTGGDPLAYAEGILKICEVYLASPLACVVGVTGGDLKRRIEAIISNRTVTSLNYTRKAVLTVAAMITVAVPVAVGIIKTPLVQARSQSSAVGAPSVTVSSRKPSHALLAAHPESKLMTPQVAAESKTATTAKFEVASIKPTSSGQGMMIRQLSPGRLSVDHAPLPALIQSAFGARPWEISGGPAWILSAYYAIDAKAPGPASSTAMWRMVRPLLEDRFKMKWHREKRVMPVYILSVAKSGKLPKPQEGSCLKVDLSTPPSQPAPGKRQLFPCGSIVMPVKPPRAELYGGKVPMAALVDRLTGILGRPVIDQTGFVGTFDLELEFAYEASRPYAQQEPPGGSSEPQASEPSGASLFAALRQQLGLRIQSDKAPIDVIVIDSIERPSSN